MSLPAQELRTFFVTSVTIGRKNLLQSERMALLLIDVFNDNRRKGRFFLHEFVIMPDHFHLLITPAEEVSLEKAVQYVKGGFSFRAGRELELKSDVWQKGFTNHRVHSPEDYQRHRAYIRENPVTRGLSPSPELFAYSSANPRVERDAAPPWLKPR
ncbi:MAG: REP-associated tyrosine transposase [Candidatus Acidiferrales bacterium]